MANAPTWRDSVDALTADLSEAQWARALRMGREFFDAILAAVKDVGEGEPDLTAVVELHHRLMAEDAATHAAACAVLTALLEESVRRC